MSNTMSIESALALDGRIFAMLTHWRLAGETEQESWLDPAQWPEQGAIGISLASQRWHWLHIDGPVKFYKPQTGLGNSHQEQW